MVPPLEEVMHPGTHSTTFEISPTVPEEVMQTWRPSTLEIWQTWRPSTLAPEAHAWQNDTLEHPRHTPDNEGMTRHGRRLLTNADNVRGPPNPPPTTPAGWLTALEEAESKEGLKNSLKRSLAVFKARDAEADKKKADSKEDSDSNVDFDTKDDSKDAPDQKDHSKDAAGSKDYLKDDSKDDSDSKDAADKKNQCLLFL